MHFLNKHIIRLHLLLLLVFGVCLNCSSQDTNSLPPNQPEQDACGALTLCGNSFTTPYSYTGIGRKLDLSETPCLLGPGGGEVNSVWLRLNVATAGKIVFAIKPVNADDDYDFAVLKVSSASCENLNINNVVRCNLNANYPGSNVAGVVGLSLSSNLQYVHAGATGSSYCSAIDATAGESYLVMINNFGNYVSGGASKGFTIDFTGTTATFSSGVFPQITDVTGGCAGTTSLTINLNTEILCSSIAVDGTDFSISGPDKIISASGVNCSNNSGYTRSVIINFQSVLPVGNYVLQAEKGSDANSLVSICNNELQVPSNAINISVTPNPQNFLPPDVTKCFYADVNIIPTSTFSAYQWSDGNTAPNDVVTKPGTYKLDATNANGCLGEDSIIIKDSSCPEYLHIPTAFTPNNDGLNDLFRPSFEGKLVDYHFIVYDRWGKKVFVSANPSQSWNGTINGLMQPAGVYVWTCVYTLFAMEPKVEKGTVVLIR